MNFILPQLKHHFSLGDIVDRIKWEHWERTEQHKRYQKRLAKPISEMKYLDRVVRVDGCRYWVAHRKKKAFPTLEKALEACRKLPMEQVKKIYGNSIRVMIYNPNAPDIFDESLIPPDLLVRDCKDVLCVFAKIRYLTVVADLSEVYTETFDLPCTEYTSHDNLFDYGLLYGSYPVYTGKELCLSKLAEPGENVPFVPEDDLFISDPSIQYDGPRDICLAYHCWYVEMEHDGSVYDDGDGAYPSVAVPVSTFVNIGKAGVYWECWRKIWEGADRHVSYSAGKVEKHLFRFALLECKSSEVPEGQEYYTIIVSNDHADGLLPDDAANLSLRDSREKLWVHAKEKTVCISPAFDEVYWETFELQDAEGHVFHFCFDYALLEKEPPKIEFGKAYPSSYWSKARWGNCMTNTEVVVCTLPDPDERYSGRGDIALYCVCALRNSPMDLVKVPVSTLKEPIER